jgi:hypothetical protein
VSRGNEVLGQIFGSKDVSRTVAQNAASRSGLDPSLLKKMLPMLAMLVAGYMAKQRGAGSAAQAWHYRPLAGSAAYWGAYSAARVACLLPRSPPNFQQIPVRSIVIDDSPA